MFCEVHYGWGTQIDGIETTRKEQMLKVGRCGGTSLSSRVLNNTKIVYAADLVSIVVLGLSKMTACMFYEGLFAQIQLRISYFMVPAMVAWTLLSALLLGIRCSSNPWSNISAAECSGLV